MPKSVSALFFDRPTMEVAQDLLGKYLVREIAGVNVALPITEVEAYDGPDDLASHASRGRTKRNEAMFGPAGRFYVYLTYGLHWMLNIVTGPAGYPAAILIRGAGAISGPARLTKFLKIDGSFNGLKAEPASGLWIEDRGQIVDQEKIKKMPRVGVAYAGPVWSKKKYRFAINLD